MSKTAETLAQDLIEIAMTNAVDYSAINMEQDNEDKVDDDKENKSSVLSHSQNVEDTNQNISRILQQVAQLAESLHEDLQNVQIGDYIVSLNTSPLEMQVKHAISNLQIENKSSSKIISKGEGDHQEETDDESEKISKNKCFTNTSTPRTSALHSNALLTLNATDPQLEIEQQLTGSLKRKKYVNFGERIRRIFRFSFIRRRNS